MYKIIGADQKEYGPVSAEQLRQWITEGRVNGQTKVQAAGATEWKTMADVAEFSDLLPKAPFPAPTLGEPIRLKSAPRANSQMAVWSFITGIVSLLCCCGWYLVAPVAIVLGAVALSQIKSHPELTGSGFAVAGIILGIVAIVLYAAVGIMMVLSPQFMQNLQNALPQ
jgi:Domain of unknown function (DUF4190)/GYF domain 2